MPKGQYLGNLEFVILLGVLRCGGDAYGNSIQDEIEEQTKRVVSLGAIYTTLERMERKGFVTSHLSSSAASERGGRPKRLFRVMAAGERAIRQTQLSMEAMAQGLDLGLAGA
jgi:PadR family transcriptional regulator, regulatory protein PadR